MTCKFIIVGFTLIKAPKLALKTNNIEMWHTLELDDCQTEYRFLFMTSCHLQDPQTFVSLSLWAGLLKRLLKSRLYGATEAKLDYKINRAFKGIRMEIQGFNQKLHLLIDEIMSVFRNLSRLVDRSLFHTEKSILSQKLKNEFTQPEVLLRYK